QGAPDNTFIYMKLGSVPLLIMPYLGALKAWIYAPVFHLFGVSPLTVRLPAILLAAVTLLIFYRAIRDALGLILAVVTIWIILVGFGVIVDVTLPLLHFQPTKVHTAGLEVKWGALLSTLSGRAVAGFIFGNASEIIPYVPFWLIITDGFLGLGCLFLPMSDPVARENRRNGFFWLLVGFLIFIQITMTPQAGGPHHYSMIFPFPLLAFAFFAKSLYSQVASKYFRAFAAVIFGCAAMCIFFVNSHNTAI